MGNMLQAPVDFYFFDLLWLGFAMLCGIGFAKKQMDVEARHVHPPHQILCTKDTGEGHDVGSALGTGTHQGMAFRCAKTVPKEELAHVVLGRPASEGSYVT